MFFSLYFLFIGLFVTGLLLQNDKAFLIAGLVHRYIDSYIIP